MGSGPCGGGLARAGFGSARPGWLPTFDLNPLIGKNSHESVTSSTDVWSENWHSRLVFLPHVEA